MVCPMCSMDHDELGREAHILDIPRYLSVAKPCLNCGAGERATPVVPRRPSPMADAVARGKYRRDVRRLLYSVAREAASMRA